jgi:hypothetical protein
MDEWEVFGIETKRDGFSPLAEVSDVTFFTLANSREEAIAIRVEMEDRLFDADFVPYGATKCSKDGV